MFSGLHPLARLGGAEEAVLEDGLPEVREILGVGVEGSGTA